jgi:hypothetical protein
VTTKESSADSATGNNPELAAMRVHQYAEGEGGFATRIELTMNLTLPRLVEPGASRRLIRELAQVELEASTDFSDFSRLRDRVADTERQRFAAATLQAACESELPELIRRGDDPSNCESQLKKSGDEVAAFTARLRILRQAEHDAHEKCRQVAARIARAVSLKLRSESSDAIAPALAEFASSESFQKLLRAHVWQRELYAVQENSTVQQILPGASAAPGFGVSGPEAIIARAELGEDGFATLKKESASGHQ